MPSSKELPCGHNHADILEKVLQAVEKPVKKKPVEKLCFTVCLFISPSGIIVILLKATKIKKVVTFHSHFLSPL